MRDSEENNNQIGFLYFWNIFLEHIKIFILVPSAAVLVAIIYSLSVDHVYKADIVIVPSDKYSQTNSMNNLSSSLGALAGLNMNQTTLEIKSNLSVLSSRKFLQDFIIDEGILKDLYFEDWDENKQEWKTSPPSLWTAYKSFARDNFGVSEDKLTGLITVSIYWTDPELASKWANMLIKTLNKYLSEVSFKKAELNREYLVREAEKTKLKNPQAIFYSLIEKETQNMMMANATEEFAFKVIDPSLIPQERFYPKRTRMVLTGGIIGLIVSIIIVAFIRLYNLVRSS